MDDGKKQIDNEALQSGEGRPAKGQDAREYGAGGQEVISPGARPDRDVDRDPKLREAGEQASSRGRAND